MSLLFWRKTRDITPENARSEAVTEEAPLPVRLYPSDDKDDEAQRVALQSTAGVLPSAPTLSNTTLTSADTEYSVTLPAGCRAFEWQCRTEAAVRYAYETGKVAGSTAPYQTLKAGDYYYSGLLATGGTSKTLYLASATAGVVVELKVWL